MTNAPETPDQSPEVEDRPEVEAGEEMPALNTLPSLEVEDYPDDNGQQDNGSDPEPDTQPAEEST